MTRSAKTGLRALTDDERRSLERIVRARNERVDRVAWARALLAVADGASFIDAARASGRRSGVTVARLVERWNNEGLGALGEPPRKPSARQSTSGAKRAALVPSANAVMAPSAARPAGEVEARAARRQSPLRAIAQSPGFVAIARVDLASGRVLDRWGGAGFDLDVAAEGNRAVVRAKIQVKDQLGIDEEIEDIVISLTTRYHLIRVITGNPPAFLYLVLDRSEANLGMARRLLERIAGDVST